MVAISRTRLFVVNVVIRLQADWVRLKDRPFVEIPYVYLEGRGKIPNNGLELESPATI